MVTSDSDCSRYLLVYKQSNTFVARPLANLDELLIRRKSVADELL